jgi:hypothetical protein
MHIPSAPVSRALAAIALISLPHSRLRRGDDALKRIVHFVVMRVLMCQVHVLVHVHVHVHVQRVVLNAGWHASTMRCERFMAELTRSAKTSFSGPAEMRLRSPS